MLAYIAIHHRFLTIQRSPTHGEHAPFGIQMLDLAVCSFNFI